MYIYNILCTHHNKKNWTSQYMYVNNYLFLKLRLYYNTFKQFFVRHNTYVRILYCGCNVFLKSVLSLYSTVIFPNKRRTTAVNSNISYGLSCLIFSSICDIQSSIGIEQYDGIVSFSLDFLRCYII